MIAGRTELSQVRLSIFPETNDFADIIEQLRELKSDLAILGQTAAMTELPMHLAQIFVPTLVLSADLKHIRGPGPEDAKILTPESLTAALLKAVGNEERTR